MTQFWKDLWHNTGIQIPWGQAIPAGIEVGSQVIELAKALDDNKGAKELAPLIGNISSLLDVLNDPLVQVAGAALPFASVATKILKFIIGKTAAEPTLAACVELVSQAAYLDSLRDFLGQHPEVFKRFEDNWVSTREGEPSTRFRITRKDFNQEFRLNDKDASATMLVFHESKLAKIFDEILCARFELFGFDKKDAQIATKRVCLSTHRYLKTAVLELKNVVPALAVRVEGLNRDLEIYRSIDKYLKEVIEKKPSEVIFENSDQPSVKSTRFKDMYVPLEAKPIKEEEVDISSPAHQLDHWAATVLCDKKKCGRVLFIQGGPGRGKSFFCRMFADWVRKNLHPILTPILIRLRDVKTFANDFDRTLSTAVGWDFATSERWLVDSNTRFLFLLDGFDELILERGTSNELKMFLEQASDFQRRSALNSERSHRVLITGRPLALYGIRRLMPDNLERVEIIPMSEAIQEEWLQNWQNVAYSNPQEARDSTNKFRSFLHDKTYPQQVKTLAQEPLLLFLLAKMHREKPLNEEMFKDKSSSGTKVAIFEKAIKWVLEEQRSPSMIYRLAGCGPADVHSILQETGLCVVQSGRGHASISAIERRVRDKEDHVATKVIDITKDHQEDPLLSNVFAAFYLKSVDRADNHVEFIHKSFAEYLCAERMVESLEDWTIEAQALRKHYLVSTDVLEREFYDLFGYGCLTPEIVEYVSAMMNKRKFDKRKLFERLLRFYLRWSSGEFIETTEETIPQKKARRLQEQNIHLGQREVDIYAGLNALILLLELNRWGKSQKNEEEKIEFYPCGRPNTQEFDKERLMRVVGYAECLGAFSFNRSVGQYFSDVNLSGSDLRGMDLGHMDLRRANLSDASLCRAHLIGTSLQGADLTGARFTDEFYGSVDLHEIKWDEETKWANATGLHEARGTPEALGQHSRFAAAVELSKGEGYLRQGETKKAKNAYDRAQQIDPEIDISTSMWNDLCRVGCVHGYAAVVRYAGERAVELEPDNIGYLDTRALARALTKDRKGAIADFQDVIVSEYFEDRDALKLTRLRWLEELQSGKDPFTPEEMAVLRQDEGHFD